MRLGIVPYRNCLPLVKGLDVEIYEAPPAKLAELANPDDIILAPIVQAFEDPSWRVLEGVGIGSFGPVDTVKLFLKFKRLTIQNLKTISLDVESKTGAALLKILLTFYYKLPAGQVEFLRGGAEKAEAWMLIGDKVWQQPQKRRSLDLGEVWTEWTGLPFLYAAWMTQNPEIGFQWKHRLVQQAEKNLGMLEQLAARFPDHSRVLRYWQQLTFELSHPQKEAVALFQRYWAKREGKKTVPLRWV